MRRSQSPVAHSDCDTQHNVEAGARVQLKCESAADRVMGAACPHQRARKCGEALGPTLSAMASEYNDDLRLAHVLADNADSQTMDRFKAQDLIRSFADWTLDP